MNITPLSSINNKNNNTNFKQLYKVQVKSGCFQKPKDFEYFYTCLLQKACELKKSEINNSFKKIGFLNLFKTFFKMSAENDFSVVKETGFFNQFNNLKNNTGVDPWWLARRLDIEEPKPIRDGYDTFFIYTGNDRITEGKILNSVVRKNIESKLDERCSTGEIKYENRDYWRELLPADLYDEKIMIEFENKEIKEIEINNLETDSQKLFDAIYESMPIYTKQKK